SYAPVLRLNTSCRRLCSLRYPGIHLKGADTVKNTGVFLGKFIPLAFLGHHMNENRLARIPDPAQCLYKQRDVMPVNRAQIVESKVLKQPPGKKKTLQAAFGPLGNFRDRPSDPRDPFQKGFGLFFKPLEEYSSQDPAQVIRKGADILGYRHFIVIQDNNKIFLQMPRLVKPLKGQARCHSAIANYCNHLEVFALPAPCFSDSERR